MFVNRWQIGRLLGIPIYVDASWLIIFALLTASFAQIFPELLQQYFPDGGPPLPVYEYWLMGLITALAFFGCIILHELGHAVVARARGMSIRGITLFLFGGVAELADEPPSALTEFLMAIGGPVVSLILAMGFSLAAFAGWVAGWPHPTVIMLGYLGGINAIVLIFNLVPAFPLDGGRILRSILWGTTHNLRKATHWASAAGQGFAWFLMGWAVLEFLSGDWFRGIWTGLIGWFVYRAAQGSYQQLLIHQALQGEPVRHFMNPKPIVVPPTLDLLHWVEDFVYRYHRKAFPVASNGHVEGFINTQALAHVPRAEWTLHSVGELMRHDIRPVAISPDADALQALGKMQRTGSSRLLVTEGDQLLGIVSLKDLLRFLNLKMHLENEQEHEPSL